MSVSEIASHHSCHQRPQTSGDGNSSPDTANDAATSAAAASQNQMLTDLEASAVGSEFPEIFTELRSTIETAFESFNSFVKQFKNDSNSSSLERRKHHCSKGGCHGAGSSTTENHAPASAEESAPPTSTTAPVVLTFSERSKQTLVTDKDGKVTEAELRRGVVSYALYFRDPNLSSAFDKTFEDAQAAGSSLQSALEKSLIDLIASGKFPSEDANWLYSLSRRAANFNASSPDSIDATGGIDRDAAIGFAEASLAGIQSGAVKVDRFTL